MKPAQLETVQSVANVYDALRHVYDTEGNVLARIVYALRILGHRRYGYFAIRKLQQTLPSFDPHTSLPKGVDCDEFYFYQCLATVCRVIPEENEECFIKHFSRLLEINPNTVKSPCKILVRLIVGSKLGCENYLDLIEDALIKSKLSESVIREYLDSCDKICKTQYSSNLLTIQFILFLHVI